jgi:hypothetical protein
MARLREALENPEWTWEVQRRRGTMASLYLRSVILGLHLASWMWIVSVLFLLLCIAMSACLGPVLHAAQVDPTLVTREG